MAILFYCCSISSSIPATEKSQPGELLHLLGLDAGQKKEKKEKKDLKAEIDFTFSPLNRVNNTISLQAFQLTPVPAHKKAARWQSRYVFNKVIAFNKKRKEKVVTSFSLLTSSQRTLANNKHRLPFGGEVQTRRISTSTRHRRSQFKDV